MQSVLQSINFLFLMRVFHFLWKKQQKPQITQISQIKSIEVQLVLTKAIDTANSIIYLKEFLKSSLKRSGNYCVVTIYNRYYVKTICKICGFRFLYFVLFVQVFLRDPIIIHENRVIGCGFSAPGNLWFRTFLIDPRYSPAKRYFQYAACVAITQ